MDIFERQDSAKVSEVTDHQQLQEFLARGDKGILCIAVHDDESQSLTSMPETYRFAKWVRQNAKDVDIDVAPHEGTKILHSADFWMPLVILGGDISIQMFVSLVANYVYDMAKGALPHESKSVYFEALYEEEDTKKTKKFSYSGSIAGLNEIVEKFDLNDFMDQ